MGKRHTLAGIHSLTDAGSEFAPASAESLCDMVSAAGDECFPHAAMPTGAPGR